MPTFSHLFGLTPADIYGLTLDEYRVYSEWSAEYAEANS